MIRDEQDRRKDRKKKEKEKNEMDLLSRSANITADLARRRKQLINNQNISVIKNEDLKEYETVKEKEPLKVREVKFKISSQFLHHSSRNHNYPEEYGNNSNLF